MEACVPSKNEGSKRNRFYHTLALSQIMGSFTRSVYRGE